MTTAKSVIGQGCNMLINLTIMNYGPYVETFSVTSFANATAVMSRTIVLESWNFTTPTFSWNTTGFAKGNYTLWSYTEPVQGETFTFDNNLTGGWVVVAMVGDITGPDGWPDGKCDMRDIGLVAKDFGKTVPPANANCDLTGPTAGVPDGKIDMRDIGAVAKHFGEHYP